MFTSTSEKLFTINPFHIILYPLPSSVGNYPRVVLLCANNTDNTVHTRSDLSLGRFTPAGIPINIYIERRSTYRQ